MLSFMKIPKPIFGLIKSSLQKQQQQISFMPTLSKKRHYRGRKLVGYSQEQMFDVVSDVKNYKSFIPFCKQSDILRKNIDGNFQAQLVIGFPPLTESYTSEVFLISPKLVKVVGTCGKIFDCLETIWQFKPGIEQYSNSCWIEFTIAFEFKSILHSQLANIFFDQIVNQMEGAFIKEARRRYGSEKLPNIDMKAT